MSQQRHTSTQNDKGSSQADATDTAAATALIWCDRTTNLLGMQLQKT